MGKHHDKGFTLIELLIVVSTITLLQSIFPVNLLMFHKSSSNDIVHKQIEAMYFDKRVKLTEDITFNRNGNVNHAQSFLYNGRHCVIQLGYGRYRCE